MYIKNKRGQSTVEYILLVTAVIAVIIAFESSTNKGSFQATLNSTLNDATTDMQTMQGVLTGSHAATSATGISTPPSQWNLNEAP